MTSSPSYELLTSVRFDNALLKLNWNNDLEGPSAFLLLPFHSDRLKDAAIQHGWPDATPSAVYSKIKAVCQKAVMEATKSGEENTAEALKIRITLTETGLLQSSASSIGASVDDPLDLFAAIHLPPTLERSDLGGTYEIYVDSEPTDISLYTTTKTTLRNPYNGARRRAGLSSNYSVPADVLMYNTTGELTETSIFNVAFHRSSIWVTPATTSGCLSGVMRRCLLEQGRIKEVSDNKLRRDSLKIGELVLLFNAVRGCILGKITKFC